VRERQRETEREERETETETETEKLAYTCFKRIILGFGCCIKELHFYVFSKSTIGFGGNTSPHFIPHFESYSETTNSNNNPRTISP
jgi:hypothetical protein